MIWSVPTMWQFQELFLMFLPMTRRKQTSNKNVLLNAKTSFLRYIVYLNFIKDLTKHGLLQV